MLIIMIGFSALILIGVRITSTQNIHDYFKSIYLTKRTLNREIEIDDMFEEKSMDKFIIKEDEHLKKNDSIKTVDVLILRNDGELLLESNFIVNK